ncbi:MAG: V-type ATPase 116kDa subunit family protein [Archangium sp.]|nr:V-type ATPase 116kDa subunit family protein [Archangium sp.]
MIVKMTHVRLAGPSPLLDGVLRLVQDLGVLHVVRPEVDQAAGSRPSTPLGVNGDPSRDERRLRRILDDVEKSLALLGVRNGPHRPRAPPSLPVAARLARRTRRKATALVNQATALEDERVMLLRYREFFSVFTGLLGHELSWPDGQAFYVVLRKGAAGSVNELRRSLEAAVGKDVELLDRPLASGEQAVLILVANTVAPKVAQLLADSRVQELPAPANLGEKNLLRALPALEARLAAIPPALAAARSAREELAREQGGPLSGLRAWLHDRLLVLDARSHAHAGRHLFVLEGWLPSEAFAPLQQQVLTTFGPEVMVEAVGTGTWQADSAPVAMQNPPLFRPFELITRMLPLPRYGTIDPTPFVAVFFPVFFGLMLGDVGYGVMLAILAGVLRLRSKQGTRLRSVAAVAGACAAASILFGLLFGELFGSLGTRFGLHALAFDREHAIVPFLALSIALGVVHITLGLVLAVITAWRRGHRREAAGRGVAAVMVALTVLALLAAFSVLPSALFTPFVIGVLVAFPVLIALEGVVAVIELLSTYGHILSYARIMALGTASLMMAVVANEMVGAMGSVVVGVIFALFFHLVNFGIGLFSPTIHALRLHYVEFFGKFYGPGGTRYQPLTHWQLERTTS